MDILKTAKNVVQNQVSMLITDIMIITDHARPSWGVVKEIKNSLPRYMLSRFQMVNTHLRHHWNIHDAVL